ncbi:hypothetical protein PXH66_10320 [Synoicihabitans lomoniglobus]|uniref:Uncharacterized protein n=1 Tax=Synoicihabitans lomoniglobus TaxID=2909285 RepID=A0AAF0I5W8_9BACT|nr:hypothetical protein PXH66_10320 [Opitutaceae bacterium LMO-M01]
MKSHLLFLSLVILPFASVSHADVLKLTNGSVLEGTYIGGTADAVRFQVDSTVQTIPRSDVAALSLQPTSASTQSIDVARVSPATVVVPANTALFVKLLEPLDSQRNQPGDRFAVELMTDVKVDGTVAVPAGSRLTGQLKKAERAGRLRGRAELAFSLVEMEYGGKHIAVRTSPQAETGDRAGTLKEVAIGAASHQMASGAAGTGAGLGLIRSAATKGDAVAYPAGTFFEFRLLAPVQLN